MCYPNAENKTLANASKPELDPKTGKTGTVDPKFAATKARTQPATAVTPVGKAPIVGVETDYVRSGNSTLSSFMIKPKAKAGLGD